MENSSVQWKTWLVFLLPLMVFATVGFHNLALPGLWMDAVNPDYQAVWMLRGKLHIPAWVYPDNISLRGHTLPLLNSLYGGNPSAYAALIFFQLFGYGVLAVRALHCIFAIALLFSMGWCLMRWKVPRFFVALSLTMLAAEPGFVFAWRTQFYLQLFPLIFLFWGLGFLSKSNEAQIARKWHKSPLFYGGMLVGFAAYGYFIYTIYAAATFGGICWLTRRHPHQPAIVRLVLAGILAGFSPYIYAHFMMLVKMGGHGYVENLRALQATYGVVDTVQGGLAERVGLIVSRVDLLFSGRALDVLIHGKSDVPGTSAMIACAIAFSIAVGGLLMKRLQRHDSAQACDAFSDTLLWILLGCFGLHLAFGLVMGRPLGVQHYIMLVPLSFALLSVLYSKAFTSNVTANARKLGRALLVVGSCSILFINFSTARKFSDHLSADGGQGLYSDVVNLAAEEIAKAPEGTVILFPQWGYWMGALVVSGPRYSMYESANLGALEKKLSTARLAEHKNFLLVLGQEYAASSDPAIMKPVHDFMDRLGFKPLGSKILQGRNGIDKVMLIQMSRLS
ncbi:hypothetical protein E2K99_02780 [Herbaspirillum huttiense]|uniref:hypothetical protein n=1 Tax=Herbaspirillum huttiense TaxID=863372 RepID=UPI0010669BCD|nr:hypothetical protein [Herbaspirillum huttiense]QBP74003.1 hypothetical protein E2K99_02780 [Herbaspirillum huttiense]